MSDEVFMKEERNAEMYISPQRFNDVIRSNEIPVIILDCRSATDFYDSHVRGAMNVTIPASVIMLRRLANGKMSISSIIRGVENRERFNTLWKTHWIVLYDMNTELMRATGPCVISTLFRRLRRDGCQVVCLQGGFMAFQRRFPEWLESLPADQRDGDLSLDNLRIAPVVDNDGEELLDSGMAGEPTPNDPPFPVEILPYLFLGNAENSTDLEALRRHNITYILNVTPNLPNAFKDEEFGIRYMQIPVQDHWSQNLSPYFPNAIAFIDRARQNNQAILVHCVAGISRSVTITLAYLMQKLRMSLNDAFDFVRQRKGNIAPNFNFISQLMIFERQLNLGPSYCLCQASPCYCAFHFLPFTHSTPDSGVDVNLWS
ncbi:dual specificity protein phosphatase Mpk3-like [Argiope bruennichi]|uniref:protein-tyrosine-phosphatase n=1 Tax=Argiope bruennichi TaxID=94029 RepID=A0A8T0FH66_ARGBR|nr:dual specificity protein phosphatase Mpk3-like [Argiope bruennichi]KAF8790316.1 Dual specificity protein phosphatase Mpk3 like protein [Argiope bruennichi]